MAIEDCMHHVEKRQIWYIYIPKMLLTRVCLLDLFALVVLGAEPCEWCVAGACTLTRKVPYQASWWRRRWAAGKLLTSQD